MLPSLEDLRSAALGVPGFGLRATLRCTSDVGSKRGLRARGACEEAMRGLLCTEVEAHGFLKDGQEGLRMLVNNAGFKDDLCSLFTVGTCHIPVTTSGFAEDFRRRKGHHTPSMARSSGHMQRFCAKIRDAPKPCPRCQPNLAGELLGPFPSHGNALQTPRNGPPALSPKPTSISRSTVSFRFRQDGPSFPASVINVASGHESESNLDEALLDALAGVAWQSQN